MIDDNFECLLVAALDESLLDALGILPRRKRHKKLLLVSRYFDLSFFTSSEYRISDFILWISTIVLLKTLVLFVRFYHLHS